MMGTVHEAHEITPYSTLSTTMLPASALRPWKRAIPPGPSRRSNPSHAEVWAPSSRRRCSKSCAARSSRSSLRTRSGAAKKISNAPSGAARSARRRKRGRSCEPVKRAPRIATAVRDPRCVDPCQAAFMYALAFLSVRSSRARLSRSAVRSFTRRRLRGSTPNRTAPQSGSMTA
jgi:hypothetical protein